MRTISKKDEEKKTKQEDKIQNREHGKEVDLLTHKR